MTQEAPAGPPPERPEASETPAGPDRPEPATAAAPEPGPVAPVGPPPPPPVPPVEPPPKKRRLGLKITIGVLVGLIVVCGAGFLVLRSLQQEIPAVGACLTDADDANDMAVVECDAAGAFWTVVGTDGTATRAEFDAYTQDDNVCEAYPGTELALWMTQTAGLFTNEDTEGSVICLQPVGAEPSEPSD